MSFVITIGDQQRFQQQQQHIPIQQHQIQQHILQQDPQQQPDQIQQIQQQQQLQQQLQQQQQQLKLQQQLQQQQLQQQQLIQQQINQQQQQQNLMPNPVKAAPTTEEINDHVDSVINDVAHGFGKIPYSHEFVDEETCSSFKDTASDSHQFDLNDSMNSMDKFLNQNSNDQNSKKTTKRKTQGSNKINKQVSFVLSFSSFKTRKFYLNYF